MSNKILSLLAGTSLLALLEAAPGEVAARTMLHGPSVPPHHSISHRRHSARHAPQHVATLRARSGKVLTDYQMDKLTAGGGVASLSSASTNAFNSTANSQIQNSIRGDVGIYSHVKGNSASLAFDSQAVGTKSSVQGGLMQATAAGQGSEQTGLFGSTAGRDAASLSFDNQALGRNTSVQGSVSQAAVAGQGSALTGLFVSAANR